MNLSNLDTTVLLLMAVSAWWLLYDGVKHLRRIDESLRELREHLIPADSVSNEH
jgi:hypothetical protein